MKIMSLPIFFGQVRSTMPLSKGAHRQSMFEQKELTEISLPTPFGQCNSVAEDASAIFFLNRGVENYVLAHLVRSVQQRIFCRGVESNATRFILPRFPLLVALASSPVDSLLFLALRSTKN